MGNKTLQEEIEFGRKAHLAFDGFILPFLADKRITLYSNFCEAKVSDYELLKEIKRMHLLIDSLEDEILSIINTGKMALKVVEDNPLDE